MARKLVERYLRIRVGKWVIPCPYFMNERGLRNLPMAYSGKGWPEEIETEIEKIIRERKKQVVDKLNAKNLMILCNLGIDCSGLVTNILDEHLRETGGKSIYEVMRYPSWLWSLRARLRPRTNVSASLLTGSLNSVPVQLNEVQSGDMIRRGANHVMLVEWVEPGKKLRYVHSDTGRIWEVSRGEIEIEKGDRELEDQKWSVKDDLELYKRAEGEKGLRRLKILV